MLVYDKLSLACVELLSRMKALSANLNKNVTSWPITGESLPPLKLLETAHVLKTPKFMPMYMCNVNVVQIYEDCSNRESV